MQLIKNTSWQTLCEHIYDYPTFNLPTKSCVVFCPFDHIQQFFDQIEESHNKYIIISANSDYGLVEQASHPIFADMKKWFDFVDINSDLGYNPLFLPPRCNVAHCKITDKYSVKMSCFTKATFAKIPTNVVKWYATNVDLSDDRITHIPFGIPQWSEDLIRDARSRNEHTETEKRIGFYLNFQNNTAERVAIKNKYSNAAYQNMFHVVQEEIPHEEYIKNLLQSAYVVSPPGNGFDCYRTLEALYCGAIPIIPDTQWSQAYDGLPVIRIKNYGFLENIVDEAGFKIFYHDLSGMRADFSFFRDAIEKDKSLL